MKRFLILSLLLALAACNPISATPQDSTPTTEMAIYTLTAATLNAHIPETAPFIDPNGLQIPSPTFFPAQNPACIVADGSWSTPPSGNELSIIFNFQDCRITSVLIMGFINGQWITVSNEADQPINGSQFDLLHIFSEQDQYNLSGTFTSPTSAAIQFTFYKGFRFTTDQPSPLTEDLVINTTASP